MNKEQKTKKRFFEKWLIYGIFLLVLFVTVIVMTGFVSRLINVEKNNPVLVSGNFEYLTYEGSFFYSVDEVPDNLTVIEMSWLNGARIDGSGRLKQAFHDRYAYAVYTDADGHRYIWVKDADFYKEDYVWANWEKDYMYFDKFDNSYFYKER